MIISKLVNFFGDAQYQKLRWRLLLVVLLMIVIADIIVPRHHTEFFWETIPAWGAAFGFVSCIAIIFISKFLGHQGGIMKDKDYYD